MSTVYYPFQVFSNSPSVIDIALIILNNGPELRGLEHVIMKHWNSFSVHVCADGGSNSLYDNIQEEERHLYIPNVIIGDFDSIRSDVLQYYESKGSEIIKINDQNSTDFRKALTHLMSSKYPQRFAQIYVFNCLWGRFDQVLGNVNTLYSIDTSTIVYLITEDTLIVALKTGDHVIHIKRGLEEGHCGLIPLGGPCSKCWTSGLQWNLDGAEMKFGGLISIANVLADTPSPEDYIVTVKCTHPLLFTLSHKLCH